MVFFKTTVDTRFPPPERQESYAQYEERMERLDNLQFNFGVLFGTLYSFLALGLLVLLNYFLAPSIMPYVMCVWFGITFPLGLWLWFGLLAKKVGDREYSPRIAAEVLLRRLGLADEEAEALLQGLRVLRTCTGCGPDMGGLPAHPIAGVIVVMEDDSCKTSILFYTRKNYWVIRSEPQKVAPGAQVWIRALASELKYPQIWFDSPTEIDDVSLGIWLGRLTSIILICESQGTMAEFSSLIAA